MMDAIDGVKLRLVPHWDSVGGLKCYEVVRDGEVLGRIEQYHPTFQRKPRGSRIVTSRWKSNRIYWVVTHGGRTWYRLPRETRKRAIEDVLSFADQESQ
jgi:hypothetical protein